VRTQSKLGVRPQRHPCPRRMQRGVCSRAVTSPRSRVGLSIGSRSAADTIGRAASGACRR
jgi:hypothetical protein